MSEQTKQASLWIVKGDHDLGTASITYLHIPEYLDTVTYHCQQAVEKYLKAYLIFLSSEFKFSHDLVYLLDLINSKDSDFEKYYDNVSELQGYAVEVRYPNETVFLSKDKVEKAIQIVKEIRVFVTGKMNIKIDYNSVIDG
ncbi:MAG TPA: HEPN domain-containing protein [Bacteroidales bacterium]